MLALPIPLADGRPLTVVALGAHGDDIEIGCGATLLRLLAEHNAVELVWVVLTGDEGRAHEARTSAEAFSSGAKSVEVVVGGLRDGYLPYSGTAAKELVHSVAERTRPHIVFTHHRSDLHQDHRLVSELTWNAFRDHLILEYEVPKFDGDLGSPNLFVPVDSETARHKVALLHQHFPSQATKPWFHEEIFLGLMRLRGMESRSTGPYAEAFYCRKLVLGLGSAASPAEA